MCGEKIFKNELSTENAMNAGSGCSTTAETSNVMDETLKSEGGGEATASANCGHI